MDYISGNALSPDQCVNGQGYDCENIFNTHVDYISGNAISPDQCVNGQGW